MTWWSRHATSIEAAAALLTAIVAIAALIGVKLQLDATERLQLAQSARDAYRAHLVLATDHPQFARPEDGCALLASDNGAAYEAFVDHLLYSAEQMLSVQEGWDETFLERLSRHEDYLCAYPSPLDEAPALAALLVRFQRISCPAEPKC